MPGVADALEAALAHEKREVAGRGRVRDAQEFFHLVVRDERLLRGEEHNFFEFFGFSKLDRREGASEE